MRKLIFALFLMVANICLGQSNVNCNNPTEICSDATFSGNSSGFGVQDLNASNNGCLGAEHQSSWYMFQINAGGTLGFTLQTSVDYDFAIWGPYGSLPPCPPTQQPIRCSFAPQVGPTGLGNGATDNSENGTGMGNSDGWLAPMVVNSGEYYLMLIDNYTADFSSFTLNWNLSNGASLNCAILHLIEETEDVYAEEAIEISWKLRQLEYPFKIVEHPMVGEYYYDIIKRVKIYIVE